MQRAQSDASTDRRCLARSQSMRRVVVPVPPPASRSMGFAAGLATQPDVVCPQPLLECYRSPHHPDLNAIHPNTLMNLLRTKNVAFVIIDSRYPYEYSGGHIATAKNLYTEKQISEFFVDTPSANGHNVAIIFHCEFSMNRGPHMMRFLRGRDRETSTYPNLHYPHLFLLDGGFKNFFQTCGHATDVFENNQATYTQMSDPRFREHYLAHHSEAHSERREARIQRSFSSRLVSAVRPAPTDADPCASPVAM